MSEPTPRKRRPKREPKRVVKMPGEPTRIVRFGDKPTKPSNPKDTGRFIDHFRWSHLKAYWFSRKGAATLLKLVGLGFLLMIAIFIFFGRDLPSPDKINAQVSAQTTKFFDRTGNTLLYEVYGDKNRSIIGFNEMGDNIKHATVSIEDKNFYKHGAFSVWGIARAFTGIIFRDPTRGGGSTITQQYVKNALLTGERTPSRKIKELILSIEIEQLYKKDDILKLYLNEIPYGGQVYGVEAAAKTYFGKDAKDLTLDQAATLAAIPQSPTYYSPYGSHTDGLIARRNVVLDAMVEQHFVTQAQADDAKKVDTLAAGTLKPRGSLDGNIIAPHFVHYVQGLLEEKYGAKTLNEGGYKIITSLDLDKQHLAEEAIGKNMSTVKQYGGSNASMVVTDPKTGQILAMVGSYDYNDPNFGAVNVATSDRQPGSSFKPFVYSTLMKKNYGAGTTFYDVSTDFGQGYTPKNFGGETLGVVSMRQAIANSLNIPAVKALYMAGVKESIDTAHDMGITTLQAGPDQYGLSLVLGSGEVKLVDMANAYGGFANGGTNVPQAYVLKMTDPKGNVKEEYKLPTAKRVLDPQIAYILSNMLSDSEARKLVFHNYLPLIVPGHTAAVKTGTTENYRDAWTVGYTPSLVVGVWAGNNDNRSMTISASSVSAPIWNYFMVHALAGQPNEEFTRPDGIKEVTLDGETGKLVTEQSKIKRTDIFPSWYKPAVASDAKSANVDTVSGKLATSCTPPLAIKKVYATEMHAEIPYTDLAYSRWEPPVAALAAKLGYKAGGTLPTEQDDKHSCGDTKPTVNMNAAYHGGGQYTISGTIGAGTFSTSKLDVFFDDQIISTKELGGSTTFPSFDYTATSNGSHNFKAVVTDAGLYTGEDTYPVTILDSGGSSFGGNSPTTNQSAGPVNFSWDSWNGATSYKLIIKRNNTDYLTSPYTVGGTNRTVTLIPGSYYWYVQAYNGGTYMTQSNTISFTVN